MGKTLFSILTIIAFACADPVILDKCGGALETDGNGYLHVQDASEMMSSGQTCIWTIHLTNMIGFRYHFVSIGIPGGDAQCSNGSSLGIYSVSNVIAGSLNGFRYCNENHQWTSYVEDGNVLVVVLRVDESTPANEVSFTLNWNGQNVQTNPTSHVSSFTSAGSGLVQYPVDGEYPPNSVQTWVVQPKGGAVDTEIIVDKMDMDGCTFTDPCLCDALILYVVTDDGGIEVGDRFCKDGDNMALTIPGNRFIAVFFTDSLDEPGKGQGFQMIWRQGQEVTTVPTTTTLGTTTTTTERTTTGTSTTTEDPDPPIISTCGGILEATVGKIHYKPDENYQNTERCAWIIRSPVYHSGLYLTKQRSGFEIGKDYLSIFSFTKSEHEGTTMGRTTNDVEERYLYGPVAVVVFTSDVNNQGQGFELDFKFNGTIYQNLNVTNDYFSSEMEGSMSLGGPGANDHYGNSQLSVFIMSRNNTYYSDIGWEANIRIYRLEEYNYILDPCYYDGIRVYSVALDTLTFVGKYCSDSEDDFGPFLARNLYIFVLATNSGTDDGGFEITWKLR